MSHLDQLTQLLSRLPGIGPKSASRIVTHLLKSDPSISRQIGISFQHLHDRVVRCPQCCRFMDQEGGRTLCAICRTPNRTPTLLCVVAEHSDADIIETTKCFNGLYHVLGGLLDPLEGITAEHLTIQALMDRIGRALPHEVIFAFNDDMRGQTTALYLQKLLSPFTSQGMLLSRLARGLPKSAVIEYADPVTLSDALRGRRKV